MISFCRLCLWKYQTRQYRQHISFDDLTLNPLSVTVETGFVLVLGINQKNISTPKPTMPTFCKEMKSRLLKTFNADMRKRLRACSVGILIKSSHSTSSFQTSTSTLLVSFQPPLPSPHPPPPPSSQPVASYLPIPPSWNHSDRHCQRPVVGLSPSTG